MDVTPLVRDGAQIIQSYSGGKFRVSGVVYERAVIVMPERVIEWGYGGDVGGLSEADFAPLLSIVDDVDVVLLGAGAQMAFLAPALRASLKAQGLGVDIMDTGAACRTYNVLMAEGRRVAAMLLRV